MSKRGKNYRVLYSKAFEGIALTKYTGEVVVADNGSTDASAKIAKTNGARVVDIEKKGYGAALKGGIESAYGDFIVMGDADSTYDFRDLSKIVEELDEGYDLVVGNRFLGGIEKKAMPLANRIIGNPALSFIARKLFNTHIRDFHCGLRGFTKKAYKDMNLTSSGMEFATEMIAKASLINLKITEIPTTLKNSIHPRTPHLKPIRDGLRHLKLMFTYSFIKLFDKSFNLLISIFLPIYIWLIYSLPLQIGSVALSFGTLFTVQNILLISLILRNMLLISRSLFPEFLNIKREVGNNYGFYYVFLGITVYLYRVYYWSINEFGFIDENANLKLISISSILLVYGFFEVFRFLINTTSKYFTLKK